MIAATRQTLDSWLQTSGLTLSQTQWEQIDFYVRSVEDYNRKVNITADEGEDLYLRHVADGLAAVEPLRRLAPAQTPRVADLGAGAGFIGLTLKIALSHISMTLIESSYRKYQFLNWVSAELKLRDLHVLWTRAGQAAHGPANPHTFDAVVARAVAPLKSAWALTRPLLGPNSIAILYQSGELPPEEELRSQLSKQEGRLHSLIPYRLPHEEKTRTLAVIQPAPGEKPGEKP